MLQSTVKFMEFSKFEHLIAASSLAIASVGCVSVAQEVQQDSQSLSNRSVLQTAYIARRTKGDMTEELFDPSLSDPSDPIPQNRAQRRAAQFGHVANRYNRVA